MDDFLCLCVLATDGETTHSFQSRLTAFWTSMLRQRPDDYEQVYSEATSFEQEQGRICRRYMITPAVARTLTNELTATALEYLPIDENDLYSRAEASASPDWFQIDH